MFCFNVQSIMLCNSLCHFSRHCVHLRPSKYDKCPLDTWFSRHDCNKINVTRAHLEDFSRHDCNKINVTRAHLEDLFVLSYVCIINEIYICDCTLKGD